MFHQGIGFPPFGFALARTFFSDVFWFRCLFSISFRFWFEFLQYIFDFLQDLCDAALKLSSSFFVLFELSVLRFFNYSLKPFNTTSFSSLSEFPSNLSLTFLSLLLQFLRFSSWLLQLPFDLSRSTFNSIRSTSTYQVLIICLFSIILSFFLVCVSRTMEKFSWTHKLEFFSSNFLCCAFYKAS